MSLPDAYHSLSPQEKDNIRIDLGWRPRYRPPPRSRLARLLIDVAMSVPRTTLLALGLGPSVTAVSQRLVELVTAIR